MHKKNYMYKYYMYMLARLRYISYLGIGICSVQEEGSHLQGVLVYLIRNKIERGAFIGYNSYISHSSVICQ